MTPLKGAELVRHLPFSQWVIRKNFVTLKRKVFFMPRTASLASLRKQIAALEAKAKKIETKAKPGVSQVAALVEKYKLTAADLTGVFGAKRGRPAKTAAKTVDGRSKSSLKGKTLAVKYQDHQGNKWAGRGLAPKWMKAYEAEGRNREEFLVK